MLKAFYRRNLPHLQRDYKPHFLTFCTYQRWTLPESVRTLILESCLHDHGVKVDVHAIVIMPDHVHVILTPLVNDNLQEMFSLAEITQAIKSASAHKINRQLQRTGIVWQEESFDRVLRAPEKLDEKITYIANNPVRRGLVTKPSDYPWLWLRETPT